MAVEAESQKFTPSSSTQKNMKNKAKRKRTQLHDSEIERLDSLPWNASLAVDDPFSLAIGSNELEGGFLSLEEIEEVDYRSVLPGLEEGGNKKKESNKRKKLTKQKTGIVVEHENEIDVTIGERLEGNEDLDVDKKKPKKKNKSKKKTKEAEEFPKKEDSASGFLSLEEIEEVDYGSVLPGLEGGGNKKKESNRRKKLTKQKTGSVVEHENKIDVAIDGSLEGNEDLDVDKNKPKKKNKRKKKTKEAGEFPKKGDSVSDIIIKDDIEEVPFNEADYHAWDELRLHPLIMKSVYMLGFREPTPIQKACIPAAAHQGKDVIGAAETGSGKTLAFGLPIVQRLLEEREKAERILDGIGKDPEECAPTSVLRALIITPTRELALQVTDHLRAITKGISVKVVPIVGGILTEKQERLLKARPEIIVGTPGRLWELMSGGEKHLVELHSLSFFVLDEADRMIENGHFHELQSIIDMIPGSSSSLQHCSQHTQSCSTVSSIQRKKRQTFVFSATIALSADFRKKLKLSSTKAKQSTNDGLNSIETLAERAGMRENAAVIDLTNASILANKLEESFIECREEDKDAYLYYLLTVHGEGRTIVFCTSIAALRHISSLLRILGVNVSTLHAQMQQRARLKAMDRFRGNGSDILLATDLAARGLDIPGVRTVIHYQLPHSAEVYVHRSGRTARASSDGCSIALISPSDKSKFVSLCKSFLKEAFCRFPLENSYMPEILQRLSLARQIDKIKQKESKEKASKSWFERSAESLGLVVDNDYSEDENVNKHKQTKASATNLKKLQKELNMLLSRPLQSKTFSHRYLAGAGVSPLIQQQLDELARQKQSGDSGLGENKRKKLLVIGRDSVEPLQALRTGGEEVHMDVKGMHEKRRNIENHRRKRKEEKNRLRDQRRNKRKQLKGKE